jgi:hypothetical protein
MTEQERVEKVAAAMWRAEAMDAGTPESVVRNRTPEAFAEQAEETRARWHKFARAAIAAMRKDAAMDRLVAEGQRCDAMTPQEAGSLDERMKAAGMMPLSELLKSNGAMEKWERHAGLKSFTDFVDWVHRKQREYMTMRMQYELGDKDKSDDLFEWVFAHAAVFNTVATQLRAISEDSHE